MCLPLRLVAAVVRRPRLRQGEPVARRTGADEVVILEVVSGDQLSWGP